MTSPFRDWLLMMGFKEFPSELGTMWCHKGPGDFSDVIIWPGADDYLVCLQKSDGSSKSGSTNEGQVALYTCRRFTEHQARELIEKWVGK